MPTKRNEDRLGELLVRWDELHQQGCDMTAQELCTDCPELVEELARRIEALGKMDSVLDIEDTAGPSNPSDQDPNGTSAKHTMPDVLRGSAEYRPQRHHAHGGLGEILIAHQQELGRPVALKRIRPDKLQDKARHRFLREAAITARLQHPGIVPIYGLGQDDDGPFYTMPFIQGQTLQEAIDGFQSDGSLRGDPGRRSLKFRGLLQQFITVCNTVAYAHDQGIVHRDLKPSNIMLGPYGETLVMDWGLAKPFDRDGSVSELEGDAPSPSPWPEDLTDAGIVLGTRRYMSPEQAKGEPVGPASDIFSLGLILYAILTGKSAFDESILRGADPGEAAVVPPRHRDPSLPHALEAICLKALSARPGDRYPSARALAEDVTNWLADEPVSAWREPWPIRGRRWAKRHRTAVVAAVVALVAGVVGLGAVAGVQTLANVRLKRANDETNMALAQADAVSTFLVEAFRSPDPSLDGRQVKVADVLDQASKGLDQGFEGSQATLGALLNALGLTYHGLGLGDRAVSLLTRARAVSESALGPDHPHTLATRHNLANAYSIVGRTHEAIALHEATLKLREAKLGPDHLDTLNSRNDLANAYQDAGRTSEAIAMHEATLKLREAKVGPDHRDTLSSRHNLAVAYRAASRLGEAFALDEATLKLKEAKLGPDHPDTLASRHSLANAYWLALRLPEAIAMHETTITLREAKLGPDHPDTLKSRNNLAIAYREAGRLPEAIALNEMTLKLREAKLGPDHPDTLKSRINLACVYQDAGRTSEGIALNEMTLQLMEGKLGPDHPSRLYCCNNLAIAYVVVGRLSAAIALFEGTLKLYKAKLGPDHPVTLDCCNDLAEALESLGRWAEAEGLRRDTLARRRKNVSPLLAKDLAALGHHPSYDEWSAKEIVLLAKDLAAVGHYLLGQSRWSEAEPLLREALAIREKATSDDWLRYDTMSLLGGALLGQGRYADAEPLVVGGYEGMKAREARIYVPERSLLHEAAERIVRLFEGWNKPDHAAAWKVKLGMPDLPTDVFARS
jgi:serine/threonine protein kinase/tetratricopeptide (TPR) repeat protein